MARLFRLTFISIALIVGFYLLYFPHPAPNAAGPASPPAAEPPPASDPAPPAAKQPRAAPAMDLPQIAGGKFSLAQYRGKAPVLLFFFATW